MPSLLDTVLEAPPRTRGIWRAKFRLGESRVLPVLVLNFPAPDSYTGEHAAELLIPGNPNLVARVIAAITAHPSVREATPGEFSARAFLNGKLTVEQAEGVAATIAAATDDQLAAARLLLAGETGRRYQQWADEVATLLALVEAGIDFTDQEDVIPIAPGDLVQRLTCVLEQIESACGSLAGAEQGESRPTVVLSGRPNAGKSTLFNALLGRTRAVVSPLAGTTRDVLAEPLDLSADVPGGPVVTLIDLAGLDEAAPSGATADANAQLAAREALAAADVVIHCDPTGRFADPISSPPNRATIRIRTMGDLPVSSGSAVSDALAVCALDGWNLAPLRRAIADAAWSAAAGGGVSRNADTLLPRHRRVLTAAAGSISAALETVRPDAPRAGGGRLAAPELVAGSLREALDTLGELTGRISPDDIVGRIFATFCVGK